MNEDKSLKDLLQRGLMESTSPDFTDEVMGQLHAVNADKISRSLLITKRWKLLYKIAFAVLSLAVIIMSFLVKPFEVNIQPLVTERITERVLLFIIFFWILLIINYLFIDKKIRKPFM